MKQDTEKTTVIFRKWKNGEIIALFPYEIWNRSDITSYMHVGQHSGACYGGCIRETKLAKPNEYEPLKKELETIGYNLEVREKYNHSKYLKAYYQTKN